MATDRQSRGLDEILRATAAARGSVPAEAVSVDPDEAGITERERTLRRVARWIARIPEDVDTLRDELEQRLADEAGKPVYRVDVPVDLSHSPEERARVYLNRHEVLFQEKVNGYIEAMAEEHLRQQTRGLVEGTKSAAEQRSAEAALRADVLLGAYLTLRKSDPDLTANAADVRLRDEDDEEADDAMYDAARSILKVGSAADAEHTAVLDVMAACRRLSPGRVGKIIRQELKVR